MQSHNPTRQGFSKAKQPTFQCQQGPGDFYENLAVKTNMNPIGGPMSKFPNRVQPNTPPPPPPPPIPQQQQFSNRGGGGNCPTFLRQPQHMGVSQNKPMTQKQPITIKQPTTFKQPTAIKQPNDHDSGFQTLNFSNNHVTRAHTQLGVPGSEKITHTQKTSSNFSSNTAKKNLTGRDKKKSKKKDKDRNNENNNENGGEDDKKEGDENNQGDENCPVEESLQLNIPAEGLVEFFLQNHTLDKKSLRKDFASILDYTRLVYNFMSNPTKNRFNNVLCFNEGSVVLKPQKPDDGEYIHASRFDTNEGKYIMTQAPLANTVEDFWRLIWQENVTVIVSFVNFSNPNECVEYFNIKKGKKKSIGRFTIKTVDVENLSSCKGYFLTATCKGNNVAREIAAIQWTDWVTDQPVDVDKLLKFMKIVWNLEKIDKDSTSSNSITLVHGVSGTRRTGTFVVLNLICKQLFFKKKCSLISTALLVRKNRHNVLRDKNMFAVLLVGLIRFSLSLHLLRKDRHHLDKVEFYIKNALISIPAVGKKYKARQDNQNESN
uniref:Tyrosine-protein phosphatase domain-containing protein n=1 Tax=Strongyloides stercoralis TaxID=6248 RepID=A0A0K0DUE6_STRER